MKTLFIKRKFLELILAGKKSLEVRVCYPSLESLKVGGKILLNRQYLFRIERVSKYKDFNELLDKEDPERIYPGKSKDELLYELKRLYSPEKESLGVMAIEIMKEGA